MPDFKQLIISAKRQFAAQHSRFFLWSPAPLMLGILLFFSLPADPSSITAYTPPAILLLLWCLTRKSRFRSIFVIPLLISLGFAASQYRTQSITMPLITQELRYRHIEGRVELAEPGDKKIKVNLTHLTIEDLPPSQTPPRIHITLRGEQPALQAGDRIRFKANLMPLPAPTMPGGFDFSLYYYFNGIGGTGYSLSAVEILSRPPASGWNEKLNHLRHAIGENMRLGVPGQSGAVAAAMTINETGPISKEINENLRDSGLFHILSISGFHLAVVTGIVFAAIRMLLCLIPAFALRVNTKKIAACLALIAVFFYLALAAYPLPAQRSFIMVAFVFIAILCDRRGISLRSMCFAALFLLLAFPESLFSASFQLSFAATLAIVSLYENWPLPQARTLPGKAAAYLTGIFASSLAASLATAPFIIYDFNRLSLLGILSNMIVLPLASVVIMPAIILAVLLMPFGLEWFAYIPLTWGIDAMLSIATATSGWSLSAIRLPALTEMGLLLATLGLLWICLWRGHLRWWGVPLIILSLATIHAHDPIDVFVSAGAKQVLVRLQNGHYTALKGTDRAYAVQSWLQSEAEAELIPLKESGIPCNTATCTYTKNGHTLIIVLHPQSITVLDRACAQTPDILIAQRYLKSSRCAAKILVGKTELEAYGPHSFRLKPTGIQMQRTHEANTPRRLWQPATDVEEED